MEEEHSEHSLSPRPALHSLPRKYGGAGDIHAEEAFDRSHSHSSHSTGSNSSSCSDDTEQELGEQQPEINSACIGRNVCIAGIKTGVLRYYGRTHFQEGLWCGIELDTCEGRHSGQVQGVQYFDCAHDRGIFAPLHKVSLILQASPEPESPRPAALKRENTFTVTENNSLPSEKSHDEIQESCEEVLRNRKRVMESPLRPAGSRGATPKAKRRVVTASPNVTPRRSVECQNQKPKRKEPAVTTATTRRSFAAATDVKSALRAYKAARRGISGGGGGSVKPDLLPKRKAGQVPSTVVKPSVQSPLEQDVDESLGILSPSEMRGLPSLSASMNSNFAWEKSEHSSEDDDDEEEEDEDEEEEVTFSEDDPSSCRLRQPSPVKSFALDSEKLRQFDALTDKRSLTTASATPAGDAKCVFLPPPAKNSPKVPKEKKSGPEKPLNEAADLLLVRTEELLRSSRQRRERIQQEQKNRDVAEVPKVVCSNSSSSNSKHIDDNDDDSSNTNSTMVLEDIELQKVVDEPPQPLAEAPVSHEQTACLSADPSDSVAVEASCAGGDVRTRQQHHLLKNLVTQKPCIMTVSSASSSGIGSMPSSMISMATSQEQDDLEDHMAGQSEMKTNISPIEEKIEEDQGIDISETEDKGADDPQPPAPVVKHCEEEQQNSSLTVDKTLPAADSVQEEATGCATKRKSAIDFKSDAKRTQIAASKEPPRNRSRSNDKKGLATKRSELLKKDRIKPNLNVPSKVNTKRAPEVPRKQQPKKAGRWDEIMFKIAESQAKGVTSKASSRTQRKRSSDRDVTKSNSTRDSSAPTSVPDTAPPSLASRTSSRCSMLSEAGSRIPVRCPPTGSRSSSIGDSAPSNGASHSVSETKNAEKSGSKVTKGKKKDGGSGCASAPASGPASLAGPKGGNNKTASSQQNNSVQAHNRKNATLHGTLTKKKSGPTVSNSKDRPESSTTSSRTTSAASITTSNNKPDLVKGVDEKEHKNKKSQSTETVATASSSPKEVAALREMVRFNARAFEAMAITLDHVTNKMNGLKAPELDQQLKELKTKLAAKDKEIASLSRVHSEDAARIEEEQSKFKLDTDAILQECNLKIEKIKDQHRHQLDSVIAGHQSELEDLADARIGELTRQDDRHSAELDEVTCKFKAEMAELDAKWGAKLLQEIEAKNEELRAAECTYSQREDAWEESRRSLEEQIHALKMELRDHEAALSVRAAKSAKNKENDARLALAQQKLNSVTQEVESLKAVLELKTDEVKRLRLDNIRLEEKLEQFDAISLELRKANALVEDLKEQIQTKTCLERKLSAENRKLYNTVEREQSEKKRISMENEELQWRIRQSTEQLSMSYIEGPSCSSGSSSLDSNPCHMRTQLSCSFSEGCPPHSSLQSTKSLPPFFASRAATDSPRVFEVVKKAEAVSWKIEYQEDGSVLNTPAASSSPRVQRSTSIRRKRTPPQPQFEPLCETSSEEEASPMKTPEPVNIVSEADGPSQVGESDLSSSSEIEIESSAAKDNVALRGGEQRAAMNASLPSYDLQRLFASAQTPKGSGGESLAQEEVSLEEEEDEEEEEEISTVSWSEGME